jgi:23S rRNA (cytosine1962-C5)-methyltransferase
MGNVNSSGESLATRQVEPSAAGRAPLRLRVTAAAESILRAGHPWLYAESIRSQNRTGETGDLAVVYDRKDQFLAVGLFDPGSTIRVRVLHTGKPKPVDGTFWRQRLEDALRIRRGLFDAQTTGFRLINGESDGWPGLVLDRYDQTLVLKIYTAAWLPWLDAVAQAIHAQLPSERIVLRLSRNIQQFAGEHSARQDGQVLLGAALSGPVNFLETGLSFEAEVQRGQKTGFFLDQRENRRQIETMARGRSVLNAFSFSGGFSVYAARGGARSVLDLDISPHALASAERNFALNCHDRIVSACRQERLQADAFEWLEGNRSVNYDLIILDPPSLARRETERAGAIQAYARLASLGIRHLAPGGILLACSCSAHVSEAEFFGAVRSVAARHKPGYTEIGIAGQPPDHPAAFLEAKYLKAIYLGFK